MSIITFFVKKASAILKFIKKLLHKKFIVIKLACFRDESSARKNTVKEQTSDSEVSECYSFFDRSEVGFAIDAKLYVARQDVVINLAPCELL